MTRPVTVLATHQMIELETRFESKPIPFYCFDWCAVDYLTYDLDSPTGYGRTEVDAVNALFDELEAL
jgi:hypothetical protein